MYQQIAFLEAPATSFIQSLEKAVNNSLGSLIPQALEFLKDLVIAILILYLGKKLIKYGLHILERYFNKLKMEASVSGFLLALIKAVLYILLVAIIVVNVLGIERSSIAALIGSAGLSIGLALQGGLSNFAGGVLILLMKPFRVGDYIISGGNEGTVTAIDIFYTRLVSLDNRLIVMPNGILSNNNIVNVTNEPNRRLELLLPIEYAENIQRVKELILNLLNQNDKILKDEEIRVFVSSLNDSSISIGLRVWVASDDYLSLKWQLLEEIKNQFDTNGIRIPFNQLDVTIRKQE
ncbi:MAG: MscS Mechanosensitive ion channel [Lachnospiraceae bacterium]|jgi:small conductance mechanosensitive channel|nr:MscS Mechanosensitive ion channel [Lachnospiraceae bacterium]